MNSPADSFGLSTHRLVTNRDHAPTEAWVRAENAVLETLLSEGLSLHVALGAKLLRRSAPTVYETLSGFEVPDQTPLTTDHPVVEVPPERVDELAAQLAVELTDEGTVPAWRHHGISELVAFDPDADRWHYYSVPRKSAIRAVDEPGPLREPIRAAVAAVPCTELFPRGALASWRVADVDVQITVEGLWLERADGTERWYPHEQLQGVVVDEADCELVLAWPRWRDEASTSLGRAFRGIVDRVRESPPRLLHPPDQSTLSTAATAFELVSERLCYGFELRRHGPDEAIVAEQF